MTYIPFTPTQWLVIEGFYCDNHPDDKRKHLPIREVAEWFASKVADIIPEAPDHGS